MITFLFFVLKQRKETKESSRPIRCGIFLISQYFLSRIGPLEHLLKMKNLRTKNSPRVESQNLKALCSVLPYFKNVYTSNQGRNKALDHQNNRASRRILITTETLEFTVKHRDHPRVT